jgi:hypothetical protein
MALLGDHAVAELLVEAEIARKLAANADADRSVSLSVGIIMGPGHQRRPHALALSGGIDRDSPDMQDADLAIEPQATDGVATELCHDPA